jgi:hypothetical protein
VRWRPLAWPRASWESPRRRRWWWRFLVGEGLKTLVPRLVGQTAAAETRKRRASNGSARSWDENAFFAALAAGRDEQETAFARKLYAWAGERGWKHTFGTGSVEGTWLPALTRSEADYFPIVVRSSGVIRIRFQHLAATAAFAEAKVRLALLEQVNMISGAELGPEVIERNPSIPLSSLASDPAAFDALTRTLSWVAATATEPPHGSPDSSG